jgi:NAD(P)H-dependent FMN reductase
MPRIAIIVGSTRPNRRSPAVAQWVYKAAQAHAAVESGDTTVEVVDIVDYDLPLFDAPVPPAIGGVMNPQAQKWAQTIGRFDGFIFVTPEYNHCVPASLKNAIDFVYREWNDKAAAIVSYGVDGGVRAGEALRLMLAEVRVATVRSHIGLSLFGDFTITDRTKPGECTPGPRAITTLAALLDELVAWSSALITIRVAQDDEQSVGA